MSQKCDISVVLLCKGRGADAASYRPNRDESQWWSRRDALVRCVTAFLFGPVTFSSNESGRELILIFDDDFAKVYLTLDRKCSIVPTEQAILSLFKQAALSLNKPVCQHGLTCRIQVDPTLAMTATTSHTTIQANLPTGLDSKRQVLEYLQQQCSLEFLRDHSLNSNPSVVLRKTNKKELLEVWTKWQRQQTKAKSSSTASSVSRTTPKGKIQLQQQLQQICEENFRSVLEHIMSSTTKGTEESDVVETVVGILHESCEEFPCFFQAANKKSPNHKLKVALFLGAVRDMSKQENEILHRLCQKLKLPRVGIRFGTVPEFTSKILTILAYHHANDVVPCALQQLLSKGHSKQEITSPVSANVPTCLHVVSLVPITSTDLSTELNNRDRIHWSIVRIVVCTLWRSRMVSSDANGALPHSNTLTLFFQDGVVLTLSQQEFVDTLANQHQAAPSEYQILKAVQDRLSSLQSSIPEKDWSKKGLTLQVMQQIVQSSPQPVTATISISSVWQGLPSGEIDTMSNNFYSVNDNPEYVAHKSVVVVLNIQGQREASAQIREKDKKHKVHHALLKASGKLHIPVFHQPCALSLQDSDAATITIIQHFLYQNRLFLKQMGLPPTDQTLSVSKSLGNKKRKRTLQP